MRCVIAAVMAWLLFLPVRTFAADGAQARVSAYQAETRETLKKHHWRITFDQGGKLVGRHVLGPGGDDLGGAYSEPAGYARLTILFKPKSGTDTETTASIVAVHLESTTRDGKFVFADPVPFDNPAASKSVQDLLAEAKKRMLAAHPGYGAR